MTGPTEGTPARGYSWPPFTAGNEAAVRHGAYSESRLAPVAAAIEREWRAAHRVNDEDPAEVEFLTRWVRARASEELFWHWMVERPQDELVTEITSTDGDETARRGKVTRRSTVRRRAPLLDQYAKLQDKAASRWKEYRAYLDGRDRGRQDVDAVLVLTQLRELAERGES